VIKESKKPSQGKEGLTKGVEGVGEERWRKLLGSKYLCAVQHAQKRAKDIKFPGLEGAR
jgi:hypothetical protein